jgi:cytidyltransferase-like protein
VEGSGEEDGEVAMIMYKDGVKTKVLANPLMTPPRLRNAFLARNRVPNDQELPWMRVPGLAKLELPHPVVLINGCYDLLHAGHAKLIFAARDKAATLVCGLDGDKRVGEKKGIGRPIQSWIERATMLGFFPLDYLVEIESDNEMRRLVEAIKPDLRVLGIEYKDTPTKFPAVPRMFVTSAVHTSEIIKRCQDLKL